MLESSSFACFSFGMIGTVSSTTTFSDEKEHILLPTCNPKVSVFLSRWSTKTHCSLSPGMLKSPLEANPPDSSWIFLSSGPSARCRATSSETEKIWFAFGSAAVCFDRLWNNPKFLISVTKFTFLCFSRVGSCTTRAEPLLMLSLSEAIAADRGWISVVKSKRLKFFFLALLLPSLSLFSSESAELEDSFADWSVDSLLPLSKPRTSKRKLDMSCLSS